MAGNGNLRVDTNNVASQVPAAPPIAAAFLVRFDTRKGYTIAWQKCVDGLELEGVVDYKALPSGLHNVHEDLVYFVYDDYSGIDAFLNEPASESERNARMLAVGVLVPLDHGRMGKSWRHAQNLKELAREQMNNMEDFTKLEEYWEVHKISDEPGERPVSSDSPLDLRRDTFAQPPANGYRRTRGISNASFSRPVQQSLSSHHPALSLPAFISLFEPLIFPLYRAALLRKRILLVGEPPVETNCNFAYALSLLSALPKSLLPLLPIDGIPDLRPRPLFNVGVPDIPYLATTSSSNPISDPDASWIACTTDDVLGTKSDLFDVLVILPPAHAKDAKAKMFPKIFRSTPELSRNFPKAGLKATQRDARRYRNMRAGLRHAFPYGGDHKGQEGASPNISTENEADDTQSIRTEASGSTTLSRPSLIEPTSWSLVAYTSFIWWASAGEKGTIEEEDLETERDAALLSVDTEDDGEASKEVAIVQYFQRLTSLIFTTISDAMSRNDGEALIRNPADTEEDDIEDDDEAYPDADDTALTDSTAFPAVAALGGDGTEATTLLADGNDTAAEDIELEPVPITMEHMTQMGLDIWSAADREFVEQLGLLWWGRKISVRGARVECCGLKIL